jgi:bla regulator protein BlaR1
MKQCEHQINNVIKNALHKYSPSMSFESLWDMHSNKGKTTSKYRRAALIPLIVVFTLFACITIGYAGLSRLTDNTNLPFVKDPEVIGKWQVIDFVDVIKDFSPEIRSAGTGFYLNDLVFIKNGRMLDRIENTNLSYSGNTWTKGFIINELMKTTSKYEIKEIDGGKYMFKEWKSGDYINRFMKPKYYVLKQIDTEDYSNYEVQKIQDKIDYPFINNSKMLGTWESVDFVDEIDSFKPSKLLYEDSLFLKELDILEDGRLLFRNMDDQIATTELSWTGDLIIDHDVKTASKCIIKTIDSETYMFYEWKSGDYVYRGVKPQYYVLKMVE